MSLVRDVLAILGICLTLFGLAQWSHALAYVVAGIILISLALCWSILRRTA